MPPCATLLDRLRTLPEAAARPYRFRLIPVPLRGEASQRAVTRLNCLAERDRPAALKALLAQASAALPEAPGTCGQGPAQRALVTAHLLGIDRLPVLIAPDGRVHAGLPADPIAWLKAGEGTP